MAQKLETFCKENGFPLEFTQIIETTHVIGKKNRITSEEKWSCALHSPFLGQSLIVSHKNGGGSNHIHMTGKTKKEVRTKIIEYLRGSRLEYGAQRDHSKKVPMDIF
jgi:hypothetical protein